MKNQPEKNLEGYKETQANLLTKENFLLKVSLKLTVCLRIPFYSTAFFKSIKKENNLDSLKYLVTRTKFYKPKACLTKDSAFSEYDNCNAAS